MKSKKLSISKNKQYKKSTKHRTKKPPKHSKKKTKSEIKRNRHEKKRKKGNKDKKGRGKKTNKEEKRITTLMNGGGGCGCSASEKKNSMMEYMADLKHDLGVNIQGGGGYTVMPADNQHFSNIVEYNDNNPPEIKELRI